MSNFIQVNQKIFRENPAIQQVLRRFQNSHDNCLENIFSCSAEISFNALLTASY